MYIYLLLRDMSMTFLCFQSHVPEQKHMPEVVAVPNVIQNKIEMLLKLETLTFLFINLSENNIKNISFLGVNTKWARSLNENKWIWCRFVQFSKSCVNVLSKKPKEKDNTNMIRHTCQLNKHKKWIIFQYISCGTHTQHSTHRNGWNNEDKTVIKFDLNNSINVYWNKSML